MFLTEMRPSPLAPSAHEIVVERAPDSGAGNRNQPSRPLLDHFGTGIQTSEGSAHNEFSRNVIRYIDHAWVDHNGSNEFEKNKTLQVAP